MLVPALGFVILVLVIALVVMMLRKPKRILLHPFVPARLQEVVTGSLVSHLPGVKTKYSTFSITSKIGQAKLLDTYYVPS